MNDGQAESQFEYQYAGGAEHLVQQIKQDFRQPFMIEPCVVWKNIVVGICLGHRSRLPDIFTEFDMAPQIEIGAGIGKSVDRVAVNQNPGEEAVL